MVREQTKVIIVLTGILFCAVYSYSGGQAEAQNKIIRKAIRRPVAPPVAPAAPPKMISLEVEPEAPLPLAVYEFKKPSIFKGFFGWSQNTDMGASYLSGRGSAFNVISKLAFPDPFNIGSRLGLAEDAFEYKVGLGLVFGNDANNRSLFSLPLLAEAVVYLMEGSFFGFDPYLGGGLNLNLIGTDSVLGGMGWQLYGGISLDLGSEAGKTGLSIGYYSARVGNIRTIDGLTISIAQPFIL